jgi:hypothetical protein
LEPQYICPDCGLGASDVPGTCDDCGADLVLIDSMGEDKYGAYSKDDISGDEDEDESLDYDTALTTEEDNY